MTKDEFQEFLTECNLSNSEAAQWFNQVTGATSTSRYIANMSNGNQPVSKAAIAFTWYVREKFENDALKETLNEIRSAIEE